jgi:hypothetical protein
MSGLHTLPKRDPALPQEIELHLPTTQQPQVVCAVREGVGNDVHGHCGETVGLDVMDAQQPSWTQEDSGP